jgi:hypothetical protein
MNTVRTSLVWFWLALAMDMSAGVPGPGDIEQLKQKHTAAEASLKELTAKLSTLRSALTRQGDMPALAKRLEEATSARDAKAKNDPKVAAARQAANEASAAARKVGDAELATNPEYAGINKELADLEEAAAELQSQERIARFILSEVRSRVARQPALKKLVQAKTAALAAARGKGANSAEAKAAADATEACAGAVQAKTTADPQGAEQIKKLAEVATKLEATTEARRAAAAKLAPLTRKALARNEKVVAARSAEMAAFTSLRTITAEQTKAEQEALDKAQQAYDDALEARFLANPAAVALRKQVEEVRNQVRELAIELRLAEKAANR